ncbi:MAG: LPXTG cell wall anchor domain-containing protein [Clostridia bacterium]|nr:LPXTG cell wall anchor domain-containing protein [Clostridia bacterium]
MKKILAVCLATLMVLGMSTTAFAAGFVSSPSSMDAPAVISFEPLDKDCSAELIVVSYGDRDKLPKEQRELFEKAYESLKDSKLSISDLFFLTSEGCDDHDDHKGFKIALDADTLKNFADLMWMDEDGNWHSVEGAFINADGYLEFTLDYLNVPMAIVVKEATSPQTGDNNSIYIYGILMLVSAAAVVVLAVKSKKYA